MVYIEEEPKEICLAGNPIAFGVFCELAHTAGINTYARDSVRFFRRPLSGDTIEINANDTLYSLRVYADTDPEADTRNALHIIYPAASGCTCELVAGTINSHPELSLCIEARVDKELEDSDTGNPTPNPNVPGEGGGEHTGGVVVTTTPKSSPKLPGENDHEITVYSSHLTLYARTLDIEYINVQSPDERLLIAGLFSDGWTRAKAREGYTLHQRVNLPGFAPEIANIANLSLSVDAYKKNKNDIGELLHPYFNCALNWPAPQALLLQSGLLLKYKCYFWETFPDYTGRMAESSLRYALPGRKSAMKTALEAMTGNGEDAALLGQAFLSSYKGIKTVYSGFPEKLFYLAEPGTYYLGIVIDGRVYRNELEDSSLCIEVAEKSVIELNVDPDTIGVQEVASGFNARFRQSRSYDITLYRKDGNNFVECVARRAYRKAAFKPANFHAFLFVNEYGVPETAFLTGIREVSLNINRTLLEVKGEEAADQPLKVDIEQKMTVGSGYTGRDEWEWLCNMQRSLQVWELTETSAIACTLTNTKNDKIKEGNLYSHTFEYKYCKEGCMAYEAGETFPYIFDTTFNNMFN